MLTTVDRCLSQFIDVHHILLTPITVHGS